MVEWSVNIAPQKLCLTWSSNLGDVSRKQWAWSSSLTARVRAIHRGQTHRCGSLTADPWRRTTQTNDSESHTQESSQYFTLNSSHRKAELPFGHSSLIVTSFFRRTLSKMRGRYKRKDSRERRDETADLGAELCPLPGGPAAGSDESHRPVPGFTVQGVGCRKKGRTTCSGKLPVQWQLLRALARATCCWIWTLMWVSTLIHFVISREFQKRSSFYISPICNSC